MSIKHGTNRYFPRVNPDGGGGDKLWELDANVVNLVDDNWEVGIGLEVMSGAGEKLRVLGGIQSASDDGVSYLELEDGQATALSPAGTGRLRYDGVTSRFEISENGGAWQPIATGAAALWADAGTFIYPVNFATRDVVVGSNAMSGGGETFRVVGRQVVNAGAIPLNSDGVLVDGNVDASDTSVARFTPIRSVAAASGTIRSTVRASLTTLAADDPNSAHVVYLAEVPTIGAGLNSVGAYLIRGDRSTGATYPGGLVCLDQDLNISCDLLTNTGDGTSILMITGTAVTDGRGGNWSAMMGNGTRTTPGSSEGGVFYVEPGDGAALGVGNGANGGSVIFKCGDGSTGDGTTPGLGGSFYVTVGQGSGTGENEGQVSFANKVNDEQFRFDFLVGGPSTSVRLNMSLNDGSQGEIHTEPLTTDQDGPNLLITTSHGQASVPGAYRGGDIRLLTGDAAAIGANSAEGGNLIFELGDAAGAGGPQPGGGVTVNPGAGAGGATAGMWTFVANASSVAGQALTIVQDSLNNPCFTVGLEQWAYVGDASDPSNIGDFAAGKLGAARMFYDQVQESFNLYDNTNTLTIIGDAFTNGAYVGIGAVATAGPSSVENLRVSGRAYMHVDLSNDDAVLLVEPTLGTGDDLSAGVRVNMIRSTGLAAGEAALGFRSNVVSIGGDSGDGRVAAYYAATPTLGNPGIKNAAFVLEGDDSIGVSVIYETALASINQDLRLATAREQPIGSGPRMWMRTDDGKTDGQGGDWTVSTGDGTRTAAGASRGGEVSFLLGNAASVGANEISGAGFAITLGDASSASGNPVDGGSLIVDVGQGAGGGNTGRMIVRDTIQQLELHYFHDLGQNFLVGFSNPGGGITFGSERIGGDMAGPATRIAAASGDATTPGAAFAGGNLTIGAGNADSNGAFGAAGGTIFIGGGNASSGGPAVQGGSISFIPGAGAGGGLGGDFTFTGAVGDTGVFFNIIGDGGVATITAANEGYVYVGTASDPATQGDFAAGLAGQARMFYDQDQESLNLYDSGNNLTILLDAVTNGGYVGIGTGATAGPVGAEQLRVDGPAYIDGKLTVTGIIDPTAIEIDDTDGGSDAAYVQMTDGQNASVSSPNEGRIIYNANTQSWQISANTGAFVDIATGASAGPWTESGTQVYTDNLAWDVAVGANAVTGTERFHVAGDSSFGTSPAANGLIRMANDGYITSNVVGGGQVIQVAGVDNTDQIRFGDDDADITNMIFDGPTGVGFHFQLGSSRYMRILESEIRVGEGATGGSYSIEFSEVISDPSIFQITQTAGSTNGRRLQVRAQTASGATSNGGELRLKAGDGTQLGGTTNVEGGECTTNGPGGAVNLIGGDAATTGAGRDGGGIKLTGGAPVAGTSTGASGSILLETVDSVAAASNQEDGTRISMQTGNAASGAGGGAADGGIVEMIFGQGAGGGYDGGLELSSNGGVYVQMADGQNADTAPANEGRIIYNDSTNTFQISVSTGAYVDIATGGAAEWTRSTNTLEPSTASVNVWQFDATAGASIIRIEDSAETGTVGDALTVHAQDMSSNSGNTGGLMTVRGGDAALGGTSIGGNLELRPGIGDTKGNLVLQEANGGQQMVVNATGVIVSTSQTSTPNSENLWVAGPMGVHTTGGTASTAGAIRMGNGTGQSIYFTDSSNNNIQALFVDTSANGYLILGSETPAVTPTYIKISTGQELFIFIGQQEIVQILQDEFRLEDGDSDQSMKLSFVDGRNSGNSAAGEGSLIYNGNTGTFQMSMNGANYVDIASGGATEWTRSTNTLTPSTATVNIWEFATGVSNPEIQIADGSTGTGNTLIVHGQDMTVNTATGGDTFLRGGNAATGGSSTGGDLRFVMSNGDTPGKVIIEDTGGTDLYTFANDGSLTMEGDYTFAPATDDDGNVGTASKRFTLIRGVTVTSGDLAWEEDYCAVCGQKFEEGEGFMLYVKKQDKDELGKPLMRSVPVHPECVGYVKKAA